jgi:hypothetical protein
MRAEHERARDMAGPVGRRKGQTGEGAWALSLPIPAGFVCKCKCKDRRVGGHGTTYERTSPLPVASDIHHLHPSTNMRLCSPP